MTNTGASDELESPMAAIEPYEVDLNGESVILLDTPGLDTTRDKADVFHMIAEWLKGQAKWAQWRSMNIPARMSLTDFFQGKSVDPDSTWME